jgi:6-phosphogluconolactonase
MTYPALFTEADRRVHVHDDAGQLARAVAAECLALARTCIGDRQRFRIALAGGRTPRTLYRQLATAPADEADWSRWEIFYGDERCVAADHPDSNHRMAREVWLDHVPIPPAQIHPMVRDPRDPPGDALAYAGVLEALPRSRGMPVLDLVLLGLGTDGHTASLFPDTDILAVTDRPVSAVHLAAGGGWRISLTRPVLEQARNLWFLVTGAGKAAIVARILGPSDRLDARLPAATLHPAHGATWHLDRAAAREITR